MTIPLLCVFAEVPDPRRETENKRHLLEDHGLRRFAGSSVSLQFGRGR
jgi:hypothetical protein